MGPYIVDGHFMYGNTYCVGHRPPYYNTICHHIAPTLRGFPLRMIANQQGDGVAYSEPEGYDEDGDCTNVVRSSSLPNITSITAKRITTLRIKLWGITEDDDYYVDLAIGNRYAITYLVAGGYAVADGYLTYIDSSISDECTKYVGNYDTNVLQAYIGLDCSTSGNSDKRKIYIASIRKIEELEEGDEYDDGAEEEVDYDELANQKLDKIIHMLKGSTFISQVIDTEYAEGETPPTKPDGCTPPDVPMSEDGLEYMPLDDLGFGCGGKDDHKCNCDCSKEDDNKAKEKAIINARFLVRELNKIIATLRDTAKDMILTEDIDESSDDGTEAELMSESIGVRIEMCLTYIEGYDESLMFNMDDFDIVGCPKKSELTITKKCAIIIRYIKAIKYGLTMEEIETEEDETE